MVLCKQPNAGPTLSCSTLGVPVIDQTGLTGYFNIDLRWDARHPRPADAVKQAMLNRLGLELVPSRELVEMLVIEKAR